MLGARSSSSAQRAHRWEPVAGQQRAALDLALDAVAQLFVRRAVAVADPHPQARRRCASRHRGEYHTRLRYGSPMRIRIVPGGPMLVDGRARVALAHGDDGGSTLAPLETGASVRAVPMRALGRDAVVRQASAVRVLRGGAAATGSSPAPFLWDVPDPAGPPAIALKPDGPIRVAGDVEIDLRRGAARRSRPVVGLPLRRLAVSAGVRFLAQGRSGSAARRAAPSPSFSTTSVGNTWQYGVWPFPS